MKVLVFGYSDNPERYSYKAAHMLKDYKHEAVLFNPRLDDPKTIDKTFETITLYVGKEVSNKFTDFLLGLKIKRVIFNPGTENESLEAKFNSSGVEVIHGCTLVMLKTDQF